MSFDISVSLLTGLSVCLSVCNLMLVYFLSVSENGSMLADYCSAIPSFNLLVRLSVWSVCQSVCLSVCLFVYLSVCKYSLSVIVSVSLSVCLSACLSVSLPQLVRLPVSLTVS